MKKSSFILAALLCVIVAGIAVTYSIASKEAYVDWEAQEMRSVKDRKPHSLEAQEQASSLAQLEEHEWEVNERLNLSPEAKEQIEAEKKRSLEKNLEEIQEHQTTLSQHPLSAPLSEMFQAGVHEGMTDAIDAREYKMMNYWTAGPNQEGKIVLFSAGYKKNDPLQGVVEMHSLNDIHAVRFFPSPTAKGPLKIVSEENGLLTLRALEGNYSKEDLTGESPEENVWAPGHKLYYFNTQTLQFNE